MTKYLHAEELAHLAGVHKSTVLLAIRRGVLKASRTVGRSARIAPEDARVYLHLRGKAVPTVLEPRPAPQVTVITESPEVVDLVGRCLPQGAVLQGRDSVYGALVGAGAMAPSCLVIDLDLQFINPVALIRMLRGTSVLADTRIVAVGLRDELFSAARAAGAESTLIKVDHTALAGALGTAVGDPGTPPTTQTPPSGVFTRP